jgi:hypothetical protein
MSTNKLPTGIKGGLAAHEGLTRDKVDPQQLRIGTEIELEHTDEPKVAERIALDHLAEHPQYYTFLVQMEKLMDVHKTKILKRRRHGRA